jgi:hypothetical protein
LDILPNDLETFRSHEWFVSTVCDPCSSSSCTHLP